MLELTAFIPAIPLAGFVVLALWRSLPHRAVAVLGAGSVGLAAAAAGAVAAGFFSAPPPGGAYTQVAWQWMSVGGFAPRVAFHLDALSLLMVLVVTGVGFLILLYSTAYMALDAGPGENAQPGEGYGRFFAYMNLFVASMLVLVLADNLPLLYLGWEGVGACSYLLIGFWYAERAYGRAAMKAFLVTRVGDAALALGLFLLYRELGTLDIQPLLRAAEANWPVGSTLPTAAALLLLGGAVGKSAQLPLQTWLPDAMAGPTPTSALIHAATMVTAGVYLIARTHAIFDLAPAAQSAVAAVGAATLLIAGFSALAQRDIKRVLAYSTVSQIGYMFLALGAGAYSASMFHFMTHAFFKSLLFLGAGAVILATHHEHDIFRMGGLRKAMPAVFWTFLLGAASLSALPLVTAGFYSKDLILFEVWSSPRGGALLWTAGLVGAIVTSLYSFRLVFLVFFGPPRHEPGWRPPRTMTAPLAILAGLSVVGGFVELPHSLGGGAAFSRFLRGVLPPPILAPGAHESELTLQIVSSAAGLAGIAVAYLLYVRRRRRAGGPLRWPVAAALHRFWLGGGGFDWLYDRLIVRPIVWFARVNRGDFVDALAGGLARACDAAHRMLARVQTGRVRWYAACLAGGAAVLIFVLVWL